ncbi:hypothetical protein HMF7854_05675 [Sphingomonas ginkgonis]|uniref:Spermidine synthase n=1 Tax=Sphingomonas ginkgonis TaxID=2315330 RepID=A0A3R9YKW3_9SPHN|nr:hypothetical protein HMF7854_05675 [Sphingomonas ginkgonis]
MRARSTRWRFVATIFLGSFLLFLVQPLVARLALPRLGGAPAVWNSAMLVYQALLLAGYAYAHLLSRLAPRTQAGVHLALFGLAALTLPIGLSGMEMAPDANPLVWVPWLLLVSIGPIFFVVSAQAPLIQRWFAMAGGGDPYPLYAASNLGSFAGLLAYPLLAEPLTALAEQRVGWSIGFGLLALAVAGCATALPKSVAEEAAIETGPRPTTRQVARWMLLAAIPSGLILSTTLHLTTDIVAMPLIWVVPLGLYLLSFVAAFAPDRRAAALIGRITPFALLIAGIAAFLPSTMPAITGAFALATLLALFTVSVSLHGQLFDERPAAEHLTRFYLAMSAGGVLGGLFCALLAPLLFDWTYEHPILLFAAACLLAPVSPFEATRRWWSREPLATRVGLIGGSALFLLSIWGKGESSTADGLEELASGGIIIATAVVAIGNRLLYPAALGALMLCYGGWDMLTWSIQPGRMSRSFFGVYAVRPSGKDARMLVHGTTLHGIQNLGSPARERMPTSYYAPLSGVGIAMRTLPASARVDVVGLGSGTLSCYSRPGQQWQFFEIDPVIAEIANDPRRFTFLSHCLPNPRINIGDARLTLARQPSASADLLVVDAFSSDSVPMHLLTREAFQVYQRVLAPGGLLMVHISNRYLDLQPVLAAAAREGGWSTAYRRYRLTPAEAALNYAGSDWVAFSRSPERVYQLQRGSGVEWRTLAERPGFEAWTDDHASVLPIVRW